MSDDIKDILQRKARQLDMGRVEALKKIQELLDERYGGQAKATSLNESVLKVETPSASLASELRLEQVTILKSASTAALREISRLQIVIR